MPYLDMVLLITGFLWTRMEAADEARVTRFVELLRPKLLSAARYWPGPGIKCN